MTNSQIRQVFVCLAISFTIAFASVTKSSCQTPNIYNVTLAVADQTIDDQGRIVITMMATGDLPGVLTLAFSAAPDGTISGGEWALDVSYTAPVDPNAQPDPSLPDPDSPIGEQLIQRGVLKGAIVGGSALLSNGGVDGLTGVQLAVDGGTLEFASVPNGSGTLNGSSISNRNASTGSAVLNF